MEKRINHFNTRLVLALRFASLAVVLAMTVAVAACNATKGLGEDLQESSDNVKDAVRDAD
ncbi:MAG TPA: hypothetical protein VF777_13395 [Phycisphaerales bacterium]